MMNQCAWCGRHSSITVYEFVSQQEVCLWCHQQVMRQMKYAFWAMAEGEFHSLPKAA